MSINCVFCLGHYNHPYFAYICTDRRFNNNKSKQQVLAKVGISRHPILRLNCHNRKKGSAVGASTKSTKAGSGHYQLEFIVGPFYNGDATRFSKQWSSARKPVPRLIIALKLARNYRCGIGARDPEWLERFARKHLLEA